MRIGRMIIEIQFQLFRCPCVCVYVWVYVPGKKNYNNIQTKGPKK